MKKIFTIIIACVSSSVLMAQIPNNQFEDWTNIGAYDSLHNWTSDNFFVAGSAVRDTVNVQSGSVSLKLTTHLYSGFIAVPGAASTGGFEIVGTSVNLSKGGIPDAIRHTSLRGYYSYAPVSTAQGSIETVLFKRNGASRDTIAFGILAITSAASSYQPFNIPLTYLSGADPDTAIVYFQSSGRTQTDLGNTTTDGSVLRIDSVYFQGITAGISDPASPLVSINAFPNPANTFIIIATKWKTPVQSFVSVSDITGKLLLRKQIKSDQEKIDLKNFSSGNYFYRIEDDKGNALYNGKFSLAK